MCSRQLSIVDSKNVCAFVCIWYIADRVPVCAAGNRLLLTVKTRVNLFGSLKENILKIQQFHVLPTNCTYVFCVDLRINNDYFPIHH